MEAVCLRTDCQVCWQQVTSHSVTVPQAVAVNAQ
jgi:hypothetical protein